VRGLDDSSRLAYSRKQAAEALGMSLRHFQRHVQPHLRCVYSGQLRLYPRSELERWIVENRCEGGQAA
jgi:AraC-like DNA-binding protein